MSEWVAATRGDTMADYTETVELADWKVGDRWNGISEITPTINDATPTNDLTRVRMVFRLGGTTYELDSNDGDITITDANAWEASIPARDTFLPRAGKWAFEIEFFQAGYAAPWTLYKGTLTAHDDID